eukprot:TRINITY_DN2288_c0_g1_i1.p1 TRINITY_DN2288_c0_g1~~TRINITY_DN2288_c0_g1_i1.p1  ORF type:complete len:521 (-),score=105.44 TRINITY_DN2288_c0_g1_i1:544-2106(-)
MGASCCKGEPQTLRDAEAQNTEQSKPTWSAQAPPDSAPATTNGEGTENGTESSLPLVFQQFSLDELLKATDNFSEQNIVCEGGKQAPNVVYKGRLPSYGQLVAIKRFQRKEWEDAEQFAAEFAKVGKVRCNGVVNLLGLCFEGDNRLLVAEFMPNGTLSQHLFHWESAPMPWSSRLTVAVRLAKALHHLSTEESLPVYHDLHAYRILFNKEKEPILSCFGLMKPMRDGESYSSNLATLPPEYFKSGSRGITAESVVYSYGTILLALLSGKSIRPNQFLDIVQRKQDLSLVVDSNLVGRPGMDEAMELVPLVVECLKQPKESRPSMKKIVEFLEVLAAHTNGDAPLDMAASEGEDLDLKLLTKVDAGLSKFAQAVKQDKLSVLHDLLIKQSMTPPHEVSFESWSMEAQQQLTARKKGDKAFLERRWEDAITSYTDFARTSLVPNPLVYARRCVSFLYLGQWQDALADAMQAHYALPDWPEAFYLQAAALRHLGWDTDANDMLAQGARLERQRSPRQGNLDG